ncbi:FAD binding domain-containing protein [Adlercreutzia equolifaciens]|jgi:xanthine dehydrogenase YagS FAD-binding subunit|uniref:Molybdopterin dehydrogenase n=1 Tax=Adlercreutzia equolifaciens TaxID=446660 RepID=A0A6L8Q179_9ACTN|nr:FAD binding domain-containing protein [Adlercreutzia equolifaciens]MDR3995870.1 FAD binding domain-containing protein [Adlercreutzia sp.]MCG4824232.1 FAD binding domain-containing protein [Adlercreutzia equolifaciens]MEE0476871.1 FAD binding domain-containing protein [Adlercreutzia sp.]MEE0583579.1 FAD binding domain-containing protein [Adlercreutzia sp.]MZG27016.1 molybdopterin dehydrogenase [Adlercreutzia equolifaciens]
MKHFKHMQATSADQAAKEAASGKAWVMAGGTDLLGTLKDEIFPEYPETVIDLKTIEGMDAIEEDGDALRIGALAKLSDVAENELVKTYAAALAQAAGRVASPTIRHMGTIGGNVCQMHRCWYFRVPDDRFHCRRKGGATCPARIGDNRYHSIFGDDNGCFAVSSHDTAPALVALGATVVTTKREVPAEEFFGAHGHRSNVLEDGEVVKEFRVPKAEKSAFQKFALRKSIDFPVVNCAVAATGGETRVVLGGVHPAPWRSKEAEEAVAAGVTADSAAKAGEAAVSVAKPLGKNAYKVDIARTLVKRTLEAIA